MPSRTLLDYACIRIRPRDFLPDDHRKDLHSEELRPTMRARYTAAAFAAILFGSCMISGPDELETTLLGIWGGQHISMNIQSSAVTIEYDCAHGTINTPIVLDQGGNFLGAGTHVFEHGPIRIDDELDPHPASFMGHVSGSDMTLEVILTDTGLKIGPFLLEYGKVGRVYKCQ